MKADDPARTRRSPEDGGEEPADGGLPKVARAVGRAFGVFRRLGPKERVERPRKKIADGRAEHGTARGAARRPSAPGDPQRRTEALQQQIRELESELEPLYHLIAHGRTGLGRSGRAAGEGRRELADLVQHARSLKEALQEKRLELARVERRLARERLLAVSGPGGAPDDEPREPAPRAAKGRGGRTEGAGPPTRLRQAVQRASRKSVARDESRELIFDKTARGLLDEDPEIRRTAALRLGELEDRAAAAVLEAALEDPEDKVRVASMNALAKLGDPSAVRLFERHVADASPHARLAALRGLAKVGGPAASAQLVAALEDDAPAVRKTVATMLGWRGAAGVTMPLVLALRDEDEEVRAAAATSLAALRDDRAVLPLIRALTDESPTVRAAARRALRALVGEELDVPRNVDPAEHVEALKAWWIEARVTKAIAQIGMPQLPDEVLDAPAVPEAVAAPRRRPTPEEPRLPAAEPPAEPTVQAADLAEEPAVAAAPAREPAPRRDERPRKAVDDVRPGAESLDGLLPEEPAVAAEPEGLDDLLPAEQEAAPAGGDGEAASADGEEESFEDLLGGGDEDLDSLVAESLTDDGTSP